MTEKKAPTKRARTNYRKAADRTAARPEHLPVERVRTEPIRVTLDLRPAQHGELKKWCNLAAADLGLPDVALAQVLRVLGEGLIENPEIAEWVRERLTERAGVPDRLR